MDGTWHDQVRRKALEEIVAMLDQAEARGYEAADVGEWFRTKHVELFQKMLDAIDKLHPLWGKMDAKSLAEFKTAQKVEVDAWRWAIEQYAQAVEAGPQQEEMFAG